MTRPVSGVSQDLHDKLILDNPIYVAAVTERDIAESIVAQVTELPPAFRHLATLTTYGRHGRSIWEMAAQRVERAIEFTILVDEPIEEIQRLRAALNHHVGSWGFPLDKRQP